MNRSEFVGQISLGNPPQKLSLIFDTGSANILINSARCHTHYCKKFPSFDPFSSSTYRTKSNIFA